MSSSPTLISEWGVTPPPFCNRVVKKYIRKKCPNNNWDRSMTMYKYCILAGFAASPVYTRKMQEKAAKVAALEVKPRTLAGQSSPA